MPLSIDLSALTARQESQSTLVRFEDKTDRNAPRLNYSVPTVSAYGGRRFLEIKLSDVFWRDTASWPATAPTAPAQGAPAQGAQDGKPASGSGGGRQADLDYVGSYAGTIEENGVTIGYLTPAGALAYMGAAPQNPENVVVLIGGSVLPLSVIEAQHAAGRVLVVLRRFDGSYTWSFADDPALVQEPRPRFLIIEHYRLSSLFGDYGAGRTIKTFSLWPGEETRFFLRSWRRTESIANGASSIFDSYTAQAAAEFENTVASELCTSSSEESNSHWRAKANAGLDLGFVSFGGGGGGGGTSNAHREELAKAIAKAASHHSSSASARRETTITSEVSSAESAGSESIVERRVKNTNLSRVLNIVCRELNQEFTTYLSLVDVTVAFVNDRGVFVEVPISQLDDLVGSYVSYAKLPAGSGTATVQTYVDLAQTLILERLRSVTDYRGQKKSLIEDVPATPKAYARVRFPMDPARGNPFYPGEDIPVPGIVIGVSTHTIRTDAIIMDALLGHGVALDNYSLGMQQEELYRLQLENRRLELALGIVASGDDAKARTFHALFQGGDLPVEAPDTDAPSVASKVHKPMIPVR